VAASLQCGGADTTKLRGAFRNCFANACDGNDDNDDDHDDEDDDDDDDDDDDNNNNNNNLTYTLK
jgi:hypothetical protein